MDGDDDDDDNGRGRERRGHLLIPDNDSMILALCNTLAEPPEYSDTAGTRLKEITKLTLA